MKLVPKKIEKSWGENGYLIIAAIIAAVIFLGIYGTQVLNVTQDGWILANYNEPDNVQRYVGWTNFRNSPWSFPLGYTENIAHPDGGNIAFADSIPLLSIFFKALSPLLSSTFQYEGIYMLLIFILQGVAAAMLIKELTNDKIYGIIASIFFVLSPILLERGFRHTSLASHFIVLFAMYIYFYYHKLYRQTIKPTALPWKTTLLLSCIAVGITPYFLPMVMIFVLLISIDYVVTHKGKASLIKSSSFFLANCAMALVTGIAIGTLGSGVSSVRDGYGFYSMNLNAPINPTSPGGYLWSQLLHVRGQVPGQSDGFNYLGAGMITFIAFIAAVLLIKFLKNTNKWEWIKTSISEYGFLILASGFLTIFAISNKVVWGQMTLMTIPLPETIASLCGIFRASSRMFYPVYYILFVFAIAGCYQIFKKKKLLVFALLIFFLTLQSYDLKGVIAEKHTEMKTMTSYSFQGPQELLKLKDYKLLLSDYQGAQRYLLYITGHNNLKTTCYDFNSGEYPNVYGFIADEYERIKTNELDKDIVYTTGELETFKGWEKRFNGKADFYIWQQSYEKYWAGDMMFMVPKK